uniref:Uncharacterized protein n=1 Tax=Lepeophtheirus salmonis TaxID=72036 RepID=A0A0K2VBV7_LEPSM
MEQLKRRKFDFIKSKVKAYKGHVTRSIIQLKRSNRMELVEISHGRARRRLHVLEDISELVEFKFETMEQQEDVVMFVEERDCMDDEIMKEFMKKMEELAGKEDQNLPSKDYS